MIESVTLFRPVGANELRLIEATGMRAFPPRLPEQPIFYPVTNEAYVHHEQFRTCLLGEHTQHIGIEN